ncbi:MAG: SGNH/GDSL hydrolase family protein [Sphingobacteriales bacterium]|nr:MAG: SGNH/GDSL hydrolase family protein [Sphingobacteriales bacterium]
MLFFLAACSKENAGSGPAPTNPPADTSIPGNTYRSYLALGDSYTIGTSVSIAERFPVQTVTKLITGGTPMYPAEIKATNGWTTGDLLNSIINNPPSRTSYDLVSLLIGVNNQYQGRSQQEYRTQFTTILNKAVNFAGGNKNRVFVLSIPDYSVTPFAAQSDTVRISNEIDAFNAINREISLQVGVQYLDITNISREGRTDPAMQAGDGLHPSGKQYDRWSSLLAPMMKASL